MKKELHDQYIQLEFPTQFTQMFAEILASNDVYRDILAFIIKGRHHKENVTILDITENIQTERRVRVKSKKSYNFINQETLIDRKSAERIVDKLSSMSLIYFEDMPPYKLLFPTHRGIQVFQELSIMAKNSKSKNGEEDK